MKPCKVNTVSLTWRLFRILSKSRLFLLTNTSTNEMISLVEYLIYITQNSMFRHNYGDKVNRETLNRTAVHEPLFERAFHII